MKNILHYELRPVSQTMFQFKSLDIYLDAAITLGRNSISPSFLKVSQWLAASASSIVFPLSFQVCSSIINLNDFDDTEGLDYLL